MKRLTEAAQIIALVNHFTTFLYVNLLLKVAGDSRSGRQPTGAGGVAVRDDFRAIGRRLARPAFQRKAGDDEGHNGWII
ncbi:MAG TPA: hypothetical protein VIS78_10830 [Blastocatellia bacterium]